MSQLLKVDEVARRLAVSVGHAYRLIERGDIERVKFGEGRCYVVRVSEEALTAFIAARTQPARRSRGAA